MNPKLMFAALLLPAALSFAPESQASSYYSTGHADISISYEGGQLVPHWHGNTSGGAAWNLPEAEYAADEVIALISNQRDSASGSAGYLGVPAGTPIFVAGLINFQPWLGFGAEELGFSDWDGDLTIKLTGWQLPTGGQFAMYTTNSPGTITADIYLSTYNPAATTDPWFLGQGPNVFGIGIGGHDHYQFGFTKPGYYEITLKWSGTHVSDGFKSGSGTFGFQVVPEPSTLALTSLGLAAMVFVQFRKKVGRER